MTHTFNLDHGSIRLIVSSDGRKYRKSTGLTIDPLLWNNSAKTLRAKCRDAKVYAKLNGIHLRLQEREFDEPATETEILAAIDYGLNGNDLPKRREGRPSFYEYCDNWAGRESPAKRQRKNIVNLIRSCMGVQSDWEDIDTGYYFRLTRELESRGYSVNYIGAVVAKLKAIMNEGHIQKFHKNEDFRQFKKTMEQASTIWLTPSEVDAICSFKGTNSTERKAVDMFTVGYYTAMRFSDFTKITTDNIRDGKLYVTQRKTAGEVVIPASPKVVSVLERNGGRCPYMAQQVYNRTIKEVARKAGITEKVMVTKSKGGRHYTEFVEKYKRISSHCTRRSSITALHLAGVPLQQLCLISGHRDIQSLQRYLRLTREENAEKLKELPFFK